MAKPTKAPSPKTKAISKDKRFPQPLYGLREGEMEGLPSVMSVNKALKNYPFKKEFPWCLHIDITLKDQNSAHLPTGAEAKVLNDLEDKIEALLGKTCRYHFIGRTSWKGLREIYFYLDKPQGAHQALQVLTKAKKPGREFEYEISQDKSWRKVDFFFDFEG